MFNWDLKQKQTNSIAFITFWSQFASYTLNVVLILFLTRPILMHGLGFSEAKAYLFIGVSMAMGYLLPMAGGFMADTVVGVRRSILIGTLTLALTYALVMLASFAIPTYGSKVFIATYALLPATNSLLMATSSALVSRIHAKDEVRAKSAMTVFYMSINVGALLAVLIAPQLLNSPLGPLSIFAVVFVGKFLAALNFLWRYRLYDNVIEHVDTKKMGAVQIAKLVLYLIGIYLVTLTAYSFPKLASLYIAIGCVAGVLWYFRVTLKLSGEVRQKQLFAILLIVVALVFFVIYNQMNTTLILFAKNNSNLNLLGLQVSPASYQMISPLVIIGLSLVLPRFYRRFPKFTIPYQFAAGVLLAGVGLLIMWLACVFAKQGLINGNYFILTYAVITIAELWVSAIGLSMIGLYCDHRMISFSMGAWYLGVSLSNVVSGFLAKYVALPSQNHNPIATLPTYQEYYLLLGLVSCVVGLMMSAVFMALQVSFKKKGIRLA